MLYGLFILQDQHGQDKEMSVFLASATKHMHAHTAPMNYKRNNRKCVSTKEQKQDKY